MTGKDKNRRVNGWDERDTRLWVQLTCLPSYGRIAPKDRMVSLEGVLQTMKRDAEYRFDKAHKVAGTKEGR